MTDDQARLEQLEVLTTIIRDHLKPADLRWVITEWLNTNPADPTYKAIVRGWFQQEFFKARTPISF